MFKVNSTSLYTCSLGEAYGLEMRQAAARWHGGQGSALYEFCSSGVTTDPLRLLGEASDAMAETSDDIDYISLAVLVEWARKLTEGSDQ